MNLNLKKQDVGNSSRFLSLDFFHQKKNTVFLPKTFNPPTNQPVPHVQNFKALGYDKVATFKTSFSVSKRIRVNCLNQKMAPWDVCIFTYI